MGLFGFLCTACTQRLASVCAATRARGARETHRFAREELSDLCTRGRTVSRADGGSQVPVELRWGCRMYSSAGSALHVRRRLSMTRAGGGVKLPQCNSARLVRAAPLALLPLPLPRPLLRYTHSQPQGPCRSRCCDAARHRLRSGSSAPPPTRRRRRRRSAKDRTRLSRRRQRATTRWRTQSAGPRPSQSSTRPSGAHSRPSTTSSTTASPPHLLPRAGQDSN